MSHWDKAVVITKYSDYFDTPYEEIGQLSTNLHQFESTYPKYMKFLKVT